MTATLTTTPENSNSTSTSTNPLPKLWATFSVRTGTAIQLAGIAAGVGLIAASAAMQSTSHPVRLGLLLVGWLSAYLTSHAIAHVAVGRLFGIRFRAYGVRGTDHPENYPHPIREIMSILPMWSALTDKNSMRSASRWAKAAMFAAGETATTFMSVALAAGAWAAGIPGGHGLFNISVLWAMAASITVSCIPKGDYAKAIRALRSAR